MAKSDRDKAIEELETVLIRNYTAALNSEEGLSPALLTSARQFFSELRGVSKEETKELESELSPVDREIAELLAQMKEQPDEQESED